MTIERTAAVWAVLLAGASGCAAETAPGAADGAAAESTASVESAATVANGRGINGRTINGRTINGRTINGRGINGRTINGRPLDGLDVAYVRADDARLEDGTELRRVELDGTWLEARERRKNRRHAKMDFEGATFVGVLDDDSPIPMRIDAIARHEGPGGGDAHGYTVSFQTDAGWEPFCGTDAAGEPARAVPLAGRWDYRQGVRGGGAHDDDPRAFTFACEGYILAKCVGLGYRPWDEARGRSLAPYHQSCTRALRADYCGDGTPHTVDGVTINIYDGLGLQDDTERWAFEAEWDEDGALCVAHNRQGPLPSCAAPLVVRGCGETSHFRRGTILMTEEYGNRAAP